MICPAQEFDRQMHCEKTAALDGSTYTESAFAAEEETRSVESGCALACKPEKQSQNPAAKKRRHARPYGHD